MEDVYLSHINTINYVYNVMTMLCVYCLDALLVHHFVLDIAQHCFGVFFRSSSHFKIVRRLFEQVFGQAH